MQTPQPMPPEFELKHPRRVRWSTFATAPDSQWTHMSGFTDATPEEEAWHRINAPECGLHPDDLAAYRKSQRCPVAKLFARLRFWPTRVKSMDDYEVPAFLRNQSN